jgi:hypothetical protein
LNCLELLEAGFEFCGQLLLCPFLRWLEIRSVLSRSYAQTISLGELSSHRAVETKFVTYVDILPSLDLLDPFSHLFESLPGRFQEIMDSFPYTLRVPLCSEKRNLARKTRNIRCQGEQLVRDLLPISRELRIILILGVVLAPIGRWLGLETAQAIEGHFQLIPEISQPSYGSVNRYYSRWRRLA